MSIKTLEFNTIKTIKLINRNGLLQKVYNGKGVKFNYSTVIDLAKNGELPDDITKTLSDIFKSIIYVSPTHGKMYDKIKIEDTTPRRYGKAQVMAELKAQDGEANGVQTTALSLATLKAIQGTLNARITSDRYKGTEKLTDDKQRVINSAIRDLELKLKDILNER